MEPYVHLNGEHNSIRDRVAALAVEDEPNLVVLIQREWTVLALPKLP